MHIIDLPTGLLVVLFGLIIGVLSGMLGLGGGTMIVPLLNLVFGMPMINATSTSILCIAPTALSGSIKHLRQKTAHVKVGLIMGLSGAVASVLGSLISGALPDLIVVLLATAIILFCSIRMLLEARKKPNPDEEALSFEERGAKISRGLPFACGLGFFAGLMAGIVGVGGGFIIVPFCVAYLGFQIKEAAGTSLIAIGIIAIPGIITHALLGQVEWFYGLALIIGTIPGALVGAWLINILPDRPMRVAFSILLIIVGVLLVWSNITS